MRRAVALGMILAVLGLAPASAPAHPHVWADVNVRVLFDTDGRVRALRQTWLFDDYYSAFVLSGADFNKDGKPDQEALDAVMEENMTNLAEFDYFSRAWSGDVRVETGKAGAMSTRVRDLRLEMSFELPLTTPVAASDLPFRYAIFDPTYYIEMVHVKADDAVTLESAPAGCNAEIRQPDPNPEQVALAASLDRSQTAGDTLGQFFAEVVHVTCG